MRDSFIFYRSFFEAIKALPEEEQLPIYNAIFEFSLNFEEPQLKGIASAIFTLIKPNLEANNKRYENGKKPKGNKEESKPEAKDKQNESKTEANKDKDVDKDKDENENLNSNGENSKKENSKIESSSKEVARGKAIKYIKDLPEHKIKILKEKLEIKDPMMYQKRNNTEWRSLAVDVSDAFLDDISTPIMARNFDNELDYLNAVKVFLRAIIPADKHLEYNGIGDFRYHFTHKMKPINK